MNSTNDSPIKSLSTSLEIVKTLDACGGASLTELAERMEIADSTVFDHLKTLENHGYVTKQGNQYKPGLKFLQIGGHRRDQMLLYQVAIPELRDVANEIGERVNLVYEEAGRFVLLEVIKGEGAVFQETYLGANLDFHCTSAGKAIVAFQPEETIERIINSNELFSKTSNTIKDKQKLLTELETVRDRGYALDLEESHHGLHCVGAPIKNDNEQAFASVSISGPKSRFTEERMEDELARKITQVANVIEINHRYRIGGE